MFGVGLVPKGRRSTRYLNGAQQSEKFVIDV